MLHHAATHCTTLQQTATNCNTLHHAAAHYYTTLGQCVVQRGAVCCNLAFVFALCPQLPQV